MTMDADTLEDLLAAVRRFVDGRLVPLEAQVDADDDVPPELVAEMRDLGLFGLTIPEAYGGLGLGMEEEARVAMELGRTSPAFRSVFGTTIGIGSQGIVIDGTDAQKQHWLPRMARGEVIASFCLTEPEAGSDAAALRTRAHRRGDRYVLEGTKRYITNAPRAGVFTVMARTADTERPADGISAFIVDAATPGIRLGRPEKKMGQRGAPICDVVFDGCEVPAEAIIGGVEGRGFRTAMKVLDRGRLHIAAICVGTASRLIDEMTRYAAERRQFGRPIADFQLVQAMLADSETERRAARALVLEAARSRDAGARVTMEAAMSKYFASEMVGRVADRAVQVFGGAGYVADYGIERFYRDVRLFRIYEGTSQIQQLVIARELLADR
ncbi:MAG: acyl-CoA dehydrogenase family protein [Betaproteobacteria bacterium]|jgi:acyl-CoA dehydrogenase